jgi:hypothetical protein
MYLCQLGSAPWDWPGVPAAANTAGNLKCSSKQQQQQRQILSG